MGKSRVSADEKNQELNNHILNGTGINGSDREGKSAKVFINDKAEMILQKKLVDSLPGGIVIYRISKNIETLYFSDGILRLSGHTREEYEKLVKDNPVDNIVYKDDIPEIRKKIADAVSDGSPINVFYRIYHKDGSLVWVQLSATMIEQTSENMIYYAIFTRMSQEAEIYKNIAEHASTAIFLAGQESRKLIFANRAWKKLMGIPENNNVVGRSLYELIPAEDVVFSDQELKQLSYDKYKELHLMSSKGQYLNVNGCAVNWNGYDAYLCYTTDETQLGNSRQELLRERAMLDASMRSARVYSWRYDDRIHTVTDSGTLGSFLHLPKVIENLPESVIEMGFIHERSIDDFRELFRNISKEHKIERDLCVIEKRNKTEQWQHQIYTPIYDNDGNYVEHIGTSIDITEQKERERKYEEQIRLKRLLTNNALASAHYNITRNKVTDVEAKEPQLLKIMESDQVDDVLKAISLYVYNENEEKSFEPISSCAKMLELYRKGISHFSIRHHLKQDERWMESSFNLITNPYNGDVEAISSLSDISEMVVTEEIVKTLMDIDYESITTINAMTGEAHPLTKGHMDDVIQEQKNVGDNVAGIESYIRKHCEDKDIERVIRETSLSYVKKILETEKIHTVTYSLRLGEKLIHKRVIFTYLDDTRYLILCAMQDTTETYQQEIKQKKRLANALTEAEQANHAKTDFFSRMSHDMRTPMNGILGLAELSADEQNIDVLRSNMEKIKESGNYLLSLINDTLDWQRIESGRLVLDIQITSVSLLLDNIVDIIRPTAESKQINFKVRKINIPKEQYVRLDGVRVKQIFINLLSNAVKFTPSGGNVIFEFNCIQQEGKVCHNRIRVIDDGIGMSTAFIEKSLFTPFSQELNDSSYRYAGSGLGLSIVHCLVEMMGGKIEVVSEMGKGSAFTVYLDFEMTYKKEADKDYEKRESKQSIYKNKLMNKHILLVEDHPLNAEIASKLLARMGCRVTLAENGQQGLDVFRASSVNWFDAVLMDIRMPVMNGQEAAKAIRDLSREDARSIPIIAMTANAYEEDIRECLNAGMDCHLSKPIEPNKMYETLSQYL